MKWTKPLRMTGFLFITLVSNSYARNTNCDQINKLQMALSAHGSNIANEHTTRTTNGQHYQRLEVRCSKKCKLIKVNDFIHMYEPNHPDANEDGYVTYPNIDPGKEITNFMATINSLEMMAKQKKCGLSHVSASKGFLIKYSKGKIKEDHFILPDEMLITGWKRTLKNGDQSLFSFANF